MKINNVFLSIIHILLFVVFVAIGLIFFVLPYFPNLLFRIASILVYDNGVLFILGGAFSCFAIVVLLPLFSFHRKRFLKIKSQPYFFEVDANIIKASIVECCKNFVINKKIDTDVSITHDQKLEIFLHLSKEEDRQMLKKRAEKEIGIILKNKFFYKKDFNLVLFFY